MAKNKKYFGYFHAMGTGKTYSSINLAAHHYSLGRIDRLMVIAQLSSHLVWTNELKKYAQFSYYLPKFGKVSGISGLPIMIVGIESLSAGKAYEDYALPFVKGGKTMIIVDESLRIKNHKAIRTKKCWKLGELATVRVILTGRHITQGIHDLFSQMRFLHPSILGHKSFYTFRNEYCVLGGFQGKQIVGYQNKDKLLKLVSGCTHTVSSKQALPDLPPKVYEVRYVEPTDEQKKHLISLKKLMMTEHSGQEIEVSTILERLLRYQQIVGGFLSVDKIPYAFDKNPKIEAMLDVIEEMDPDQKTIIWARFKPEIWAIRDALIKEYGPNSVVTFFGDNAKVVNDQNSQNFMDGKVRFIVASQPSAARAMQWHIAKYAVFYSNTMSFDDRDQAEERCHRKGSEGHDSIVYVDLTMNHEIDKLILEILSSKKDMSNWVQEQLENSALGA